MTLRARAPRIWAPPTIQQVSQQSDPGQLVVLFTVDATALGGSVYRFTNSASASGVITFQGQNYAALDFQADGFEVRGDGRLPTPTLKVSNAQALLLAGVIALNDLLGATVTRLRTFSQFLDGAANADPNAYFPLEVYKIEQKTAHSKLELAFTLSAAIDQEGRRLPNRPVLRDKCTHRYRIWNGTSFDYSQATCPYTAAVYYDENGNMVSTPAGDKCGKSLGDCQLRFGNQPLPTRAFPGVARVRA